MCKFFWGNFGKKFSPPRYLLSEQCKIIVSPNIQLFWIEDKVNDIFFYRIDVGGNEFFFQDSHKIILCHILAVKFSDSCLQMLEIERYVMPDIPLKIVPITSFDTVLPIAKNKGVHLSRKKARQRETPYHKRIRPQHKVFLGFKVKRRVGVEFDFHFDRLLGLKLYVVNLRILFEKRRLNAPKSLFVFFYNFNILLDLP